MKEKRFQKVEAYRFKRLARKSYSVFNSLKKQVSIGVILGGTLAAVPLTSSSGQESGSDMHPKNMEKDLEEVMVTASRMETPIAQTTKQITIITREEIDRAPVQSFQDLLIYAANVDLVQRGGHGVQTDLSIRGGSFDQAAVLLNGINLTNAQTGHHSLDLAINLSDIERIEILHGPSALVYGANAFSGGINIITKKHAENKAYVRLEGGMHKLRAMEARGALGIGKSSNSLSVGYSSSDGYIANSDYDIYNVHWQSYLRFKDDAKLNFQLGYNDKQYGANTFYSAAYPNQYERTSTYMGTLKGEFGRKLKLIPILYWTRHHDQFDLVKDTDFGRNHHRNDTYGAHLILSYSSILGNTSFGTEIRREDIISSNLGKSMLAEHRRYTKFDDRTNWSTSLEHTVSLNKFVLSAGALMSYSTLETGKYRFLPSLSTRYNFSDNWNVLASWSKSMRQPSFTDLYYTTETHDGNEGLKAEKSESVDLSINYKSKYISAHATSYLMWGRNIIDWVKTDPLDTKWTSWNHSKINTKGVELGTKFYFGKLSSIMGENAYLEIDYSQIHQGYDAQGLISVYSLNYLKSKITAQLHHKVYKGLSASWFFRYQNRAGTYEKYENLEKVGDEPYPSYTTLDMKLNYSLENMNIYVDVKNVYNTDYFDKGNIPQAGFWLMGGLNYRFR